MDRTIISITTIVLTLLLGGVSTLRAQAIWHVDDDALPGGDGLTWASAFTYLQDGLGAAQSGDEIRVGQGLYRPDRDEVNPFGTGDRTATFQLISGVALRGGYAGVNAPDPDERDIELFETILSGDLAGDDGPGFENYDENSRHVVSASDTTEGTILDGVTIVGGNAEPFYSSGGGVRVDGGTLVISDCTIDANWANGKGGGIFCSADALDLVRCAITANHARYDGGGLYAGATPVLTLNECVFHTNSAGHCGGAAHGAGSYDSCEFVDNSARDGGGACVGQYQTMTLSNCTFIANVSEYGGGGVRGRATLAACTFSGNEAHTSGAGAYLIGNAGAVDCTFVDNFAYGDGGGVRVANGTLTNCTFTNNLAGDNGGGAFFASNGVSSAGCTFGGNFAGDSGGAVYARSTTISDCVFTDNWANDLGGGVYVSPGSVATFANCEFTQNTADQGSGMYNIDATVTVSSSTFSRQATGWVGAGIASYDSDLFVANCHFHANMADFGGGIYFTGGRATVNNSIFVGHYTGGHTTAGGSIGGEFGDLVLTNCTFSGNGSYPGGPTVLTIGDFARVVNCVYWGNDPENIAVLGDDVSLTYSCFEENEPGIGNIRANPQFTRQPDPGPDGWWGTEDDDFGDLRLLPGSPCIDAGANVFVPSDYADLDLDGDIYEFTPLDLDYEGRFFDDPNTLDTGCGGAPIVDMGAYEFGGTGPQPCVGDLNGDRTVDIADLAELLDSYGADDGGDLDCDGDTDICDLAELLGAYGDVCP